MTVGKIRIVSMIAFIAVGAVAYAMLRLHSAPPWIGHPPGPSNPEAAQDLRSGVHLEYEILGIRNGTVTDPFTIRNKEAFAWSDIEVIVAQRTTRFRCVTSRELPAGGIVTVHIEQCTSEDSRHPDPVIELTMIAVEAKQGFVTAVFEPGLRFSLSSPLGEHDFYDAACQSTRVFESTVRTSASSVLLLPYERFECSVPC
jgi:hypothetical protein